MTKEECEIETSKAIMEMRSCIAKLEKENAKLKEKMGRAGYRIAELKMQIDKMKNKLNCSKYHYCLCKDIVCKDCKDWRMND